MDKGGQGGRGPTEEWGSDGALRTSGGRTGLCGRRSDKSYGALQTSGGRTGRNGRATVGRGSADETGPCGRAG